MKSTTISIRYASLKAVQKFFGTRESAIAFPSGFDKSNADEALFLKAAKAVRSVAPNKNGERQVKPIFSFGRVLIKMSKNADAFAMSQCTVYITEYDYKLSETKTEKRVQIVIAPPLDNSDFDGIDIDDDSWLGTVPQTDDVDDTDDEDTDDDNE